MNKPLLNDINDYPDNKLLNKHLGKTMMIWDQLHSIINKDFPTIYGVWNFYNDGKSWLYKLTQKKKTICWISVWDRMFKVTFYFTDKNDDDINKLDIDTKLKENYFNNKNIGKLKPLTIEVKYKKQIADLMQLIKYKSNVK